MFKILNKCTQKYLQNLFKPFTTEYKLRDKANKLLYLSPIMNSLNELSATVGLICEFGVRAGAPNDCFLL